MGHGNSKLDDDIRRQETYVNKRMKDQDINKLKGMHSSFFSERKYNDRQLKGYLRQEFHGRRDRDSYVLDQDLRAAGVNKKHYR